VSPTDPFKGQERKSVKSKAELEQLVDAETQYQKFGQGDGG
jgi:hypothetical protein